MRPSGEGSRGALVVFAKQPRPGRVKTRMSPPLSSEQAAELAAAMLADVLDASAGFCAELGLAAVLAVDPPDACAALARGAPPAFRVVAQRGRDLSERMDRAARECAAAGAARILLRGSDSPALPGSSVAGVLRALDAADVVACPDRDGGYSLIGLRRPVPGLFAHPMSTRSVLEDTFANARRLGLRTRLEAPGFDLDTAEDLRWLARQRAHVDPLLCRRTLAYLDRARLWPSEARARG